MANDEKRNLCVGTIPQACVWLRVNSDGISGTPLTPSLYLDQSNSTDDYKCLPITHKLPVSVLYDDGFGSTKVMNMSAILHNTSGGMYYQHEEIYERGIYTSADDIRYYKCPTTLAGTFMGSCVKPSTHMFAGNNINVSSLLLLLL
jgi:hypothetical protein